MSRNYSIRPACVAIVMLTAGMGACKRHERSMVANLAVGDMDALNSNGCVTDAKKQVKQVITPTLIDASTGPKLADFADLFADAGAEKQMFWQSNDSGQLDDITIEHDRKAGDRSLQVVADLTAMAADATDDDKSSYILMDINSSMRKQGLLTFKVEQVWRIDGHPNCPKKLISEEVYDFSSKDAATVLLTFRKFNVATNTMIKSGTLEFPTESLQGEAQLSDAAFFSGKSGNFQLTWYSDTTYPAAITSYVQGPDVDGTDGLLNQPVKLHQFLISSSIDSEDQAVVLTSPVSYYMKKRFKSQNWYEATTKEQFDAADLQPEDGPNSASDLRLIGFSRGDFYNTSLTYALGLNTAGPFDNYQMYAHVQEMAAKDVPSGAPEANRWYKVTNDKNIFDLNALRTVKLSSTLSSIDAQYTKETYYLNYSDAAFDPFAAQLTSLYQRHPDISTPTMVLTILKMINGAITYDHNAVASAAVTLMRGSDAIHQGKGVCQHFAAAFTSLARRFGIPARVVSGYALFPTKDGDPSVGKHAWAEVKIGEQWIPIETERSDSIALVKQQYLPISLAYPYENGDDARTPEALQAQDAFGHHPVMVKIE